MRICLWRPSDLVWGRLSTSVNQLGRALSQRQLEEAVCDPHLDAVLLELGIMAEDGLQVIQRAALADQARWRVIVIVPATPVAYRQLLGLLRSQIDVRIALEPLGGEAIVAATDGGIPALRPRCPDRLIAMVAPQLTDAASRIVIPALAVGYRRATLADLEGASGLSGRTLRGRLRRLGLPSPSRLLGLIVGCSVAFVCDQESVTLSVVAQRLGFETADELRKHLVRHTGHPPSQWRTHGFDNSVQRLVTRLNSVASVEGRPKTCG